MPRDYWSSLWIFPLFFVVCLSGCQFAENARYLELQGELIEAQKTVRQYEDRYGKMHAGRRAEFDARRLQGELPGKTMPEVMALLGKPTTLFETGGRESWLYRDLIFDSVTKRTVKNFELWFVDGKVSEVNFSY